MRIPFTIIVFLISLSFSKVKAQQALLNDSLFEKSRFDQFNTRTPLILFVFLSPECPLCKNYSSTLNTLYDKHGSKVSFVGIIPGRAYSDDDIQLYKRTYHIQFPVIVDSTKNISNYLKATTTPEVILLNNFQMVYRGAIDDWVLSLGKMQVSVRNNYLADAIANGLNGKNVDVKRRKPVGCRINDY